jgi:hypothetical protein
MSEEDDIRIMAAADALALELGVRRVTVEKLRNRADGKTSSVNLGLPARTRNTHTHQMQQNKHFIKVPCERYYS